MKKYAFTISILIENLDKIESIYTSYEENSYELAEKRALNCCLRRFPYGKIIDIKIVKGERVKETYANYSLDALALAIESEKKGWNDENILDDLEKAIYIKLDEVKWNLNRGELSQALESIHGI